MAGQSKGRKLRVKKIKSRSVVTGAVVSIAGCACSVGVIDNPTPCHYFNGDHVRSLSKCEHGLLNITCGNSGHGENTNETTAGNDDVTQSTVKNCLPIMKAGGQEKYLASVLMYSVELRELWFGFCDDCRDDW